MENTTIRIKGGTSLHGAVTIAPNKNAILPALLASILTDETMTYKNVPESPDVIKILKALKSMGATVSKKGTTVSICCKNLSTSVAPSEHIREMQAGYLFAGPLLARFGEAFIPPSSGCQLGYRGYEGHAEYFRKLCVQTSIAQLDGEAYVHFKKTEPNSETKTITKGTESPYDKRSVSYSDPLVTPTENILMFLAGQSRFDTEVNGIAQEPHVAQLIELLRNMGAQIKGKGSTVKVRNSVKLKGTTFVPEPDHVDYFGFAVTMAMTKSDVLLKLPVTESIAHINEFIESVGILTEITKEGVIIRGHQSSYQPSATFPRAQDANTYKMNPGPWPMFPVDCLPSFIAWSTLNQNPETSTVTTNWMYDNGLAYVPVMQQMGARIPHFDHQRVTTAGARTASTYRSSLLTVSAPDVIEGVRAIISCALSGGEYVIKNAQYILRRNPNFFKVFQELGADLTIL